MEVSFATTQLQKLGNDASLAQRKLGKERADKLQLRLDQISAAAHLGEVQLLPGARCHELRNNRNEQFSLDLDGPYRLIVEIDDDPVPRNPDGGIDINHVERLLVVEIVDTH